MEGINKMKCNKFCIALIVLMLSFCLSCTNKKQISEGFLCYKHESVLSSIENESAVSDDSINNMFWRGHYDSILALDVAHLTQHGKVIYSIVLAETDVNKFEEEAGDLLAVKQVAGDVLLSICNTREFANNVRDLHWLDENLKHLDVYGRYAFFAYYMNTHSAVELYIVSHFRRMFQEYNTMNDPIIQEKAHYLSIIPTGIHTNHEMVNEFISYNDSLRQIYPENVDLYFEAATIYKKINQMEDVDAIIEKYLKVTADSTIYEELKKSLKDSEVIERQRYSTSL